MMDWEKLVSKKVINKTTKEIVTVKSYAGSPSVSLSNGIGFCVGSPVENEYEVYDEDINWSLNEHLLENHIMNMYIDETLVDVKKMLDIFDKKFDKYIKSYRFDSNNPIQNINVINKFREIKKEVSGLYNDK